MGKNLLERNTREFSWCPGEGGYKDIYIYLNHQTVYAINERETERERRQDMKEKERERISPVQSLSCDRLFVTLWTAARQTSLSITNSWSSLKLMSIESVMPSNHLILCHPLLLLPSIFLSIRVFSFFLSFLYCSGFYFVVVFFLLSQFFASGGQSMEWKQ